MADNEAELTLENLERCMKVLDPRGRRTGYVQTLTRDEWEYHFSNEFPPVDRYVHNVGVVTFERSEFIRE